MSKDKMNVKVTLDEEKGEVKVTITDEEKNKIPRVGDALYIVAPYPVIDKDDVDDEEIFEEDVKEKPIQAYSYDSVMVKATVLTEECDAVRVNGDYLIPLREDSNVPRKRLLIFTNESEARDKFRTLMNLSIKEASRREKLATKTKEYLETALEKMHH
jgi:hypothetical protein